MLSILIEHPTEGLILFETGAGTVSTKQSAHRLKRASNDPLKVYTTLTLLSQQDYPEAVGPQVNDIFARVEWDDSMDLATQIKLTGHSIEEVQMVIIGHLHLDHAGGLEPFRNSGVPIYVHELELKYAFYAVATKSDLGCYLPQYLTFEFNWVPFHGAYYEVAPGINLHHSPGHTPGLSIMQVNMKESGTWIFTGDQYHVRENYEENIPQGWLARDHEGWIRSHQMIKALAKRTGAKVVLGHCWDTLKVLGLEFAPKAYE
jgi:glyoxylase-like metal-dependent hydrolase (beta-lactamase superfamily II)